jgi:hypothetical protein
MITPLYWFLVHQPGEDISYTDVMAHGGVALLILVDGMVLHRIPLRWCHYYIAVLPFQVSYIIWSIYHALGTDIGNPNNLNNDSEEDDDDDAIYRPLNWKKDPIQA